MYSEGDAVKWRWGDGYDRGIVQSVFTRKTTRTIGGSEITRNGTSDDPACYIRVEGGSNVLKLQSEVEKDS